MNPTIQGFIRKEFAQALRDPRMRILLFGVPLIQLILFGFALSTEVRNIKLTVLYQPGDRWAQRIEERALASRWFIPADQSTTDPFRLVQSGQAQVVVVAPPQGLTRAVQTGHGEVQVLIDATNTVRARGAEQYLQAVLQEVSAEVFPGAPSPAPSLSLSVRILYNPSMKTAYFMVPAVMVMLLCIVTVILTNMALAREKEIGTFEMLISAPVKIREILLGKTVPYIVLGMIDVPIILAAAMVIFGVPMRGQVWEMFLGAFVFVCNTVSIGIFISTFARNQQQAMMGGFMFLFPAILLSGIMFPVENMPAALIGAAYLNPLMYFMTLLRNIMLKGGDPTVVWSNIGILAGMAVVIIAVSAKRFHQTLE